MFIESPPKSIVGFSLIELMVVITIVAVLSAVAVPAYKNYTIKTKISNSVSMMDRFTQDLIRDYNLTGVFPGSANFNGVTVPSDVATVVDVGPIYSILYTRAVSNRAITVSYYLKGLQGISSLYEEPTPGNPGGTYAGMHYAMVEQNGTIKYECGAWDLDGFPHYDIPASFMPAACNCNEIGDFMGSGGASGCT